MQTRMGNGACMHCRIECEHLDWRWKSERVSCGDTDKYQARRFCHTCGMELDPCNGNAQLEAA